MFHDEALAHAIYDKMLETMRNADTLCWEAACRWEGEGGKYPPATYRLWMKKPNCARVEASADDQLRGVLVLDGDFFWTFWPNGQPYDGREDKAEWEKRRFTRYMKEAAPQGHHSIAHQMLGLGAGMNMTIIQPSYFHGGGSSLDPYLDGVRSMGTEMVGEELCDLIELSFMDHQRSRYVSLAQRDHLPRKLKEIVRVSSDITKDEVWSDVRVDAPVSDDLFKWTPPEGFQEWRAPTFEEGILKAGTAAPDFDLAATDGSRIRLSDHRGQVVWLCIWRVGCPDAREEIPELEKLHRQYQGEGLVVLGLNPTDDKQIAADFLQEHEVTFPNVVDSSDAARKTALHDYQIVPGMWGVPVNYIIDREGKVADGFGDFDKERAMQALRKLRIE